MFLENFAKFTGKHLSLSIYFNKVADLRLATSLKKWRLWRRYFFCEFCEISKNTFFILFFASGLMLLRRAGYMLPHSIIVDRKKEFLKKLCFVLTRGILFIFLVLYGISYTSYWNDTKKANLKGKVFWTNREVVVVLILTLDIFLSFEVLLITPVITKYGLYQINSSLWRAKALFNTNYKK